MQAITDHNNRSSVGIGPDIEEKLNEPLRIPYRANGDDGDDPVPSPDNDEEERHMEESGDRLKGNQDE